MAAHTSMLVWEIPWTEEPGGLQATGSQRVRQTERLNSSTCSRVYAAVRLSQLVPAAPSPAVSTSLFPTSVFLFLPCKYVHQHHWSR